MKNYSAASSGGGERNRGACWLQDPVVGDTMIRDSALPMTRAMWPVALLFLLSFAGCDTNARPPNVVVVLVDDLRWDDIGIAGHPFAQTPAIDRLAREGSRFLNAFATTPLCSPSRAAILTGTYVHTNGIIDNTARDSASHRLSTFAIPMQRAGYETGFFGK